MENSPPLNDRVKVYLAYLDKEMTIMGILSAFTAAVLALVVGALVRSDSGTGIGGRIWEHGFWFVIAGTIATISATLSFYRQRSHLAWVYGQLSLVIARGESGKITDWLTIADGWDTWIHYRWGFGGITIGITAYLLALISAKIPYLASRGYIALFLLFSLVFIGILWRTSCLFAANPQSDTPIADAAVFFGLRAHPEAKPPIEEKEPGKSG